jgi:hypothetical protein
MGIASFAVPTHAEAARLVADVTLSHLSQRDDRREARP